MSELKLPPPKNTRKRLYNSTLGPLVFVFIHRNDAFAFFHFVEVAGGQVREDLRFSRGPKDFDFFQSFPTAKAKMNPEAVLREIPAPAQTLSRLGQISRSRLHARVQGEPIALRSFQFKVYPVIWRTTIRPENHGAAHEIPDNDAYPAFVKQVSDRHSAADLRKLDGRADKLAHILKRAIVLVHEKQFGLAVSRSPFDAIHLRVDMAVHQEQIKPAAVIKVEKRIAPANIGDRARSNSGSVRNIGKVHRAIVAE